MRRRPETLANTQFDILVIGGGIHGATVVREAAVRGFKAAIIEQGDFGQATSANSLKIIHGGLRYLQQADLKRIRQSIRARRKFMQLAPHLVLPQPFLIPVYGHGIKGREAMRAALTLNDLFGWDRNQNLPVENALPRGEVISRKECLSLLPDIDKKGLSGGALWYDGLVQHSERLTLTFILAAEEEGAVAVNYLRAKGLLIEQRTVIGITAEDLLSKIEFPVRARMVVNASGPWLRKVLLGRSRSEMESLEWVKGINIGIRKPLFQKYAVGLQGKKRGASLKESRFFFFVPWHDQIMIGTAYNRYVGEPDQCRLEEKEMAEFLDEINTLYPPARLNLSDVSFCHFGLQPVSEGQDKNEAHPEPDRHSLILDHESLTDLKGLISIRSTKYTTAPMISEQVLDLIMTKWNLPKRGFSQSQPFPENNRKMIEEELAKWTPGDQPVPAGVLAHHFWENYGSRSRALLDYFGLNPKALQIISTHPLLIAGEVLYGIREEMALKLSDIVLRRTNLSQAGCPSPESLKKVGEIMASELGWAQNRLQAEIDEVIQVYQSLRNLS